ncbi:low affinity cationic amino acid transporter 2-like protein [Lasius niger]|uniref:Low affinity cationic amino acid transporter 2-like protein n=1 Tax=Lasius niger TaxID=67767 RepID=A0A0J7KLR5_LASNI|nr:low affinity cationic amino acid transporter 2-like protein [Lasius niger]
MPNFTKWHFALLVISCVSFGHALECYVCTDQEGNRDKCLNTIKTCEQGQDSCLTEIKWGSTPYWSQGAKKQFYVSKKCATKKECERLQRSNMPDCTYIWYQDWKCSSCCQGDRFCWKRNKITQWNICHNNPDLIVGRIKVKMTMILQK